MFKFSNLLNCFNGFATIITFLDKLRVTKFSKFSNPAKLDIVDVDKSNSSMSSISFVAISIVFSTSFPLYDIFLALNCFFIESYKFESSNVIVFGFIIIVFAA